MPTSLCVALTACHPSEPRDEPGEDRPEINVTPSEGGSPGVFEAGPVNESDLERLRNAACVTVVTEPEPPPLLLQFVVDVSGSMALPPPGETQSKWTTTRSSLRRAVGALPAQTRLGAVYFPNRATARNCVTDEGPCEPGAPLDAAACINVDAVVPLHKIGEAGSDHRAAFDDSLDFVNPAGGTPTHDAFLLGVQQLKATDLQAEKFIILITDGQPTYLEGCSGSGNLTEPVDELPIIRAIRDAAAEGIRTFVVGSPGSEENTGTGEDARPWLSRAAFVGGTAPKGCNKVGAPFCHFDLSSEPHFSDALGAALDRILGQVKTCSFMVPAAPGDQTLDPEEVNVVLTPPDGTAEIVGKDGTPCSEGWRYQEEHDVIELCPATCESLRLSARSSVEVLLGCEAAPFVPPT